MMKVSKLAIGIFLLAGLASCSKPASNEEDGSKKGADVAQEGGAVAENADGVEVRKADQVAKVSPEEAQKLYETAKIKLSMPGPASADAIEMLWKAASAGHVQAMTELGLFLIDGGDEDDPSTTINRNAGLDFLEKAAGQGSVDAAGGLVSHYFFLYDSTEDVDKKQEYRGKMVDWAEKGNGNMLACRTLFDAFHVEALAKRVEKSFPKCVAGFEANRWNCILMEGFVQRDEAFTSLSEDVRRSVGQVLVDCYQRAADAGDVLGAEVNDDGVTSAMHITNIKADSRYAW